MLVDLARNDLGRHTTNVQVKELKDIQFFSHVIHLVSTVEGDLAPDSNPIQIFGDTFPAGTPFWRTEIQGYRINQSIRKPKPEFLRWWTWVY